MKHLRVSCIVTGAIAALLLLAGSAGATTLTSPTGTIATPTIKAESEGKVVLDGLGFECDMTLEGTVESHGSEKPAVVPLSSLVQSNCGTWQGFTNTPGKFEITWTSGYNGTVTWTGGTIEWTPFPQLYCRYKSTGHFGTITGGSPAVIHINAVLDFEAGSSICEGPRQLTGTLKITSPSSLYVDQ
jgi:hypothetical protein